MDEQEFREFLRGKVKEMGTQRAVARWIGISDVYFSDILASRRGVPCSVLERLGYERVSSIRKKAIDIPA